MSQPLVALVAQRHKGDCCVSCFAMLLGITYEDALIALGGEAPTVLRRGAWFSEMQRAAATLGVRLKRKAKWDVEVDEGIVSMKFSTRHEHVLLLREGLFFDTDLTVWEPSDYFAANRVKAGSMLVREDA